MVTHNESGLECDKSLISNDENIDPPPPVLETPLVISTDEADLVTLLEAESAAEYQRHIKLFPTVLHKKPRRLRAVGQLDTLPDIRREMGRLYRDAFHGIVHQAFFTRGMYALDCLARTLNNGTPKK